MSHAIADQRRSEGRAAADHRRFLRNLPKSGPRRDAGHSRRPLDLPRRATSPAGACEIA